MGRFAALASTSTAAERLGREVQSVLPGRPECPVILAGKATAFPPPETVPFAE